MLHIYGYQPFGYEGSLITVETDLRRGIPAIDIVGLQDGSIKESRERVRSAFHNSHLEFPSERVLISLSPCDLKKDSSDYDLSIALSIFHEQNKDKFTNDESILAIGELELSGKLRCSRSLIASVQTAKNCGIKKIVCSTRDFNILKGREKDIYVIYGDTLEEITRKLLNDECYFIGEEKENKDFFFNDENTPQTIEGTKKTIWNLVVAISGKHNLYVSKATQKNIGLNYSSIQYLTPLLTEEEKITVERIHSLAGLTSPSSKFSRTTPLRTPHCTSTIEGICGGGANCRPGEISLSHNGTLFLDEASEFRCSVLQMLRVPLESRSITLSRAGRSTVYPADFQLIMTSSSCPCGNFGNKDKVCLCSSRSIEMYYKKFSFPLLDRIELKLFEKSEETETFELSALRLMIENARRIQARYGKYNSHLTPCELIDRIKYDNDETKKKIEKILSELEEVSMRAKTNFLKVILTVSNMHNREKISLKDLEFYNEYLKKNSEDIDEILESLIA